MNTTQRWVVLAAPTTPSTHQRLSAQRRLAAGVGEERGGGRGGDLARAGVTAEQSRAAGTQHRCQRLSVRACGQGTREGSGDRQGRRGWRRAAAGQLAPPTFLRAISSAPLPWRPPSGEGAGVREGSGRLLGACSFSRPSGRSQAVRMAVEAAQRLKEGERSGPGSSGGGSSCGKSACGRPCTLAS